MVIEPVHGALGCRKGKARHPWTSSVRVQRPQELRTSKNLKGLPGMGQKWLPPLIVLALVNLMHRTNLSNRFPIESLQDNRDFGFGIPLASFQD